MGDFKLFSATPLTITLLIVVQLFCAFFFISDVIADFGAISEFTVVNPHTLSGLYC